MCKGGFANAAVKKARSTASASSTELRLGCLTRIRQPREHSFFSQNHEIIPPDHRHVFLLPAELRRSIATPDRKESAATGPTEHGYVCETAG